MMSANSQKMPLPTCYGIIPCRYHSVRFPGKPLADILGKPMFWHVYERASRCPELTRVVLATDDSRIFDSAQALQVPVVMTREDHPSGTDRVLEAAQTLNVEDDAVIVNIQGDEPALEPAMLTDLLFPFQTPGVQVTTLARKIDAAEAQNPDRVKAVFTGDGTALYFSRAPIPFRQTRQNTPFYVHIGIYAFRLPSLQRFVKLNRSPLEVTEKLEQLRLIENKIPIHIVVTEHLSMGVDRPEDIPIVRKMMMENRGQMTEDRGRNTEFGMRNKASVSKR
jgi:3-deoxy-manno-octulosonate cytidylyltransferase (CMP-KDO synthetase)